MVSAIVSFGMILLLFISGRIFESLKRLIVLFVNIWLKILNVFGIRINTKEQKIRTSKKFKSTFKDIRVVKRSKENKSIKPSVNKIALFMLLISLGIVIYNLKEVSGNAVSLWLFNNNPFPKFIPTQESMDVTLTAVLFSIMTFAISKIINQWKLTAKFRQTRRELTAKESVISKMSTKELLYAAKLKDEERYKQLVKNSSNELQKEDVEAKSINTKNSMKF